MQFLNTLFVVTLTFSPIWSILFFIEYEADCYVSSVTTNSSKLVSITTKFVTDTNNNKQDDKSYHILVLYRNEFAITLNTTSHIHAKPITFTQVNESETEFPNIVSVNQSWPCHYKYDLFATPYLCSRSADNYNMIKIYILAIVMLVITLAGIINLGLEF